MRYLAQYPFEPRSQCNSLKFFLGSKNSKKPASKNMQIYSLLINGLLDPLLLWLKKNTAIGKQDKNIWNPSNMPSPPLCKWGIFVQQHICDDNSLLSCDMCRHLFVIVKSFVVSEAKSSLESCYPMVSPRLFNKTTIHHPTSTIYHPPPHTKKC